MQAFTTWILVILLVGACCADNDPIASQIQELRKTHGMWVNGVSPNLSLPEKPSDSELLAAISKAYRKSFQLVRAQDVVVDPGQKPHRAMLIKDGDTLAVLLARREGRDWWSRVYPIKK